MRSSKLRRSLPARLAAVSRLVVVAALPVVGVVLPAKEADACGGIRKEVEPTKVLLAKAERALDDGHYQQAASLAARTVEGTSSWSETWWRSRILATAAVRSGGRVSPHAWWHVFGDSGTRGHNLAAAVAMLERMRGNERLRDDPTLLAALGEGLAQLPGREDEALSTLGALADEDLLPSPSAWAALARLRATKGLVEEARVARRTCEAMVGQSGGDVCAGQAASGEGVL